MGPTWLRCSKSLSAADDDIGAPITAQANDPVVVRIAAHRTGSRSGSSTCSINAPIRATKRSRVMSS